MAAEGPPVMAAEGPPVMAAEGFQNMGPAVRLCDATIISRFSTLRFNKVAKKFNPKQVGYIEKYGFSAFLKLPEHFRPPPSFMQWMLDHTSVGRYGVFEKKEKTITFKKEMFTRIFGLPSGSTPFVFGSDDPLVVKQVKALRDQYLDNGVITMTNLVKVMLADNTEDGFMRSFVMFLISVVLCPLTYDSVNPKYLYSLRDISMITKLDYGDLCLDHLLTEIDKWRDKVFLPVDSTLYNRPLYIGGCLPAMAVVYLDFLDFTGFNVSIDYALPRILHVNNSDFEHIMNYDRKKSSRKQFGFLPLKPLALTPYSNDALPAPLEQPGNVEGPLDFEYLAREPVGNPRTNDDSGRVIIDVSSSVEPTTGPVTRSMKNRIRTDSSKILEVVDISTGDQSASRSKKRTYSKFWSPIEPIGLSSPIIQNSGQLSGSQDNGGFKYAEAEAVKSSVTGTATAPDSVLEPIGLSSPIIQNSGQVSGKIQDNGVTETEAVKSNVPEAEAVKSPVPGTVTTPGQISTPITGQRSNRKASAMMFTSYEPGSSTPVTGQRSNRKASAMRFRSYEPGSSAPSENAQAVHPLSSDAPTGPSTRERRNRKKRAAKALSPGAIIYKKKVDPNIDAFYTKFLRNKYYVATKQKPSPTFVDIKGFPVSYERFHSSYKPRGYVSDEVMAAFVQDFNFNAKEVPSVKSYCRKFAFTPYLSSKLIKDPAVFEKVSCVKEIEKINSEVNLSNIDLLHFPILKGNNWVDCCVNSLFSSVSFFDSLGHITEEQEDMYLTNLVTNLQTVFDELRIPSKDFRHFTRFNPPDYPQQKTLKDCAFFVMLYMEHFNGKSMKDFRDVVIPKFRMIMAYNLFHSEHNKIKDEPSDKTKKRRRA